MNILMNTMCLNEAISIYKKHFYFIYLIDIVIESLDNYRSLGSVFPLHKLNLFKYLTSSNHFIMSPIILDPIPTFISSNNRRIDLTPRIVVVPFHRYHHFQIHIIVSPNQLTEKLNQNDRQSIVHNVKTKIFREHLSHQFTELIQMKVI
jgi:hypothetical protein